MAIRYLLLAALVGSTFSAHATPSSGIYGTTATGTVLLSTTVTGQVQTYMPRAVGGYFMFAAPSAPTMQPLLLPASAHFTPPSAITEPVRQVAVQAAVPTVATVAAAQVSVPAVQVSAPAAVQVSAPAAVQAAAPAAVQAAAPAAVQVSAPALVKVAAPALVNVVAPAEVKVVAPALAQVAAPALMEVAAPAEMQVAAPAEMQVAAPAEVQVFAPAEVILADLVAVNASADFVADAPAADFSARLVAGPAMLLPMALDVVAVPEPGTGGLMLAGLAGVGFMARRRRSR